MADADVEHDESLDDELARIEAQAEVAKAEAKGRAAAGPSSRSSSAKRSAKPARSGKAAKPAEDDAPDDEQSWDDFWSEIEREEAAEAGEAATTVIRGVEVAVPRDLPLKFDRRLKQLEQSEDEDDVAELVGYLFGDDVYEQWVDNGMRSVEFRTVLLWGIANGKGQSTTFRDAYKAVQDEGKSTKPNRSDKRQSAKAGRSSKRTSSGSTGSRNAASQS